MLTPLGIFLFAMVATCSLFLVISWFLDTDGTATETMRDRQAMPELPYDPSWGAAHVGLPTLTFPEGFDVRVDLDRGICRDRANGFRRSELWDRYPGSSPHWN
jgi:hypothetical protein